MVFLFLSFLLHLLVGILLLRRAFLLPFPFFFFFDTNVGSWLFRI